MFQVKRASHGNDVGNRPLSVCYENKASNEWVCLIWAQLFYFSHAWFVLILFSSRLKCCHFKILLLQLLKKNQKKKKKKWVSIQWLHRHENPCWYLGKNMCQPRDHGQISLLILSESKRIVNFLNSWKLSRFYDDFKENKS